MNAAIKRARDELDRIGFGAEDTTVMLDLLRRFFDQWDSGAAAAAAAPILQRLIAGKCLSPLTGDADEWLECEGGILQNKRCSTVFKDGRTDGAALAFDLDNPLGPQRPIAFPYMPTLKGDQ